MLAFQFGSSPSRKDAQDGFGSAGRLNGPLVQDAEVTNFQTVGILEGNAQIVVVGDLRQTRHLGKQRLKQLRVAVPVPGVGQFLIGVVEGTGGDRFYGSRIPKGQHLDSIAHALGHKSVGNIESGGQMSDQGREKIEASGGGSFDQVLQGKVSLFAIGDVGDGSHMAHDIAVEIALYHRLAIDPKHFSIGTRQAIFGLPGAISLDGLHPAIGD